MRLKVALSPPTKPHHVGQLAKPRICIRERQLERTQYQRRRSPPDLGLRWHRLTRSWVHSRRKIHPTTVRTNGLRSCQLIRPMHRLTILALLLLDGNDAVLDIIIHECMNECVPCDDEPEIKLIEHRIHIMRFMEDRR